jgi:hydrogenase nickel incorporation protein HypA/HybF
MHEMALAESVREIVEAAAAAQGASRVSAVRLEIGELSAVQVEAMQFAFDVVMRGTVAANARLEVVRSPGSAWCMRCAHTVALAQRGDGCPLCQSYQLQLTGGDELRVLDIEIPEALNPQGESSCA